MTRRNIAAGNWKMNTNLESALSLVKGVEAAATQEDVLTIVGVPFPFLVPCLQVTKAVQIAAQNMHHEEKGAFTGEVSASMLVSAGIKYVILGHSERREYQKESNELLKTKVDLALAHGLIPIFCCGEQLEIRKSGNHIAHVKNQLEESLFHLSAEDFGKIIIAYEPIWAIGTGETATPEQAQEMQQALRSFLSSKYGADVANACSILYGGSVKPANAESLFSQDDVDGGLVGGASLKVEDFSAIMNSF